MFETVRSSKLHIKLHSLDFTLTTDDSHCVDAGVNDRVEIKIFGGDDT